MNAQTELAIPATAADRARPVLLHLQAEVEKRSKAVESAEEKLAEARHLLYLQEQTIARLGAAEAAPEEVICDAIEKAGADPAEVAARALSEKPKSAHEAFTDEVAAVLDKRGVKYRRNAAFPPDETPALDVNHGADKEPDIQAGEPPAPAVNPETGEVASVTIQATEGGPHTRFSNLVAVHINEQGIDADVDDFKILALHPDEHDMFGTECDPRGEIPMAMWGSNFRVVPKGGA